MALSNPVILEAEDLTDFVRVKWNDPAYGTADAATGFKLLHDDETGTLPAWTSAIDVALAGGGDGAGNFEVLLPVPLGGVAAWWETFETYIDGDTMDAGGLAWSGAAVLRAAYVTIVSSEDFESYTDGSTMNAGMGWAIDGILR